MYRRQSSPLFLLLLFTITVNTVKAESIRYIESEGGTEIPVEVFAGGPGPRLLWLPPETGLKDADRVLARRLASLGVEVWLVDLFSARFLPLAQSSMDQMPAIDVSKVIDAATSDDRSVFLLGVGRGAIPLLRGVRLWQRQAGERSLGGVVLLHPKLYLETPDPGEPARFMPVVTQSNQALYLLQPTLSPWRWRLGEISAALQSGGSALFMQTLPGVRDRFYFRPDATEREDALARVLPEQLLKAMNRLRYIEGGRRIVLEEPMPSPISTGKKERSLSPYVGNPEPPPLSLPSLAGGQVDLEDYKGKVVLVNFWASWCPPCVHEMPSMEALYRTYREQGLEILAVNMAEEGPVVARFLSEKVSVSFPILLDSDGKALRDWGVFAFPTSFVLDRQGHIRFALFGAVDWERNDVKDRLETLF
ncbi:MAG: TlpA family protein disulfide reductase [Gammaproteobacteria bacterium]|nr:TlpA family protein disulfide reductase [Gammaproteobacteria bacterium]